MSSIPAAQPAKPDIRSQTYDELKVVMAELGQPGYRLDQLLNWLYRHHTSSWDKMVNLSASLRASLGERFALYPLAEVRRQGSSDVTQKFLWKLSDGAMVESVLIPANPSLYGEKSDRHTLCISTQVGCAYGCRFCASGLDGWKRNLRVEEIVGQVSAIEAQGLLSPAKDEAGNPIKSDRVVNNIVVMGMGEPMANYDNLMKALRIINAPWGLNIGARKITVSTSGLVPQIKKFADEPEQFRLAISLHGATDEVRDRIMPVNKKYPVNLLTDACEYYQNRKARMITLEYILIAGVNDDIAEVRPLARMAKRLNAKVNLIPYNQVDGLTWNRPSEERQLAFAEGLRSAGTLVTLRLEKGHDIAAACGQLRLKTEKEMADSPLTTA